MSIFNWIARVVFVTIAFSFILPDQRGIGEAEVTSSPGEIAKIARQTTVRIMADQSSGSGVLVATEGKTFWVLTCRHVVDSTSNTYQIRTQDGNEYNPVSTQIKRFNEANLAVIPFVSSSTYATATIADSAQLAEGDPVYVSGFIFPTNGRNPNLDEFQFTNGIISSILNPPRIDGYEFIHTSLTYTGMGGAPVWNSNGELVGIHCGGDRDPDNLDLKTGFNWGIPINTFTRLAQQIGLNLKFSIPSSSSSSNVTNSHPSDLPTENPTPRTNDWRW